MASLLKLQNSICAENLEKIAEATSRILAADRDPATVAIPILHLQSAHPNVVSRYSGVFSPDRGFWRLARSLGSIARIYVSALLDRGVPWVGDRLPERADILFVSHFLKEDQARILEDLYVGDLPVRLHRAGTTSVTALIDHTRARPGMMRRKWTEAPLPRLLLSRTIGIRNEWANAVRLSAAAVRLRRLHAVDPIEAAIAGMAASESRAAGSRAALRIGDQIRMLVRRLQPKIIVTTYEGHSWERLAFAAARESKQGILCVGYAHAPIFPFQRAMAMRLGPEYDPDVILTAGDVTRDQLRKVDSLRGIPIETLGSARAAPEPPNPSEREPICLLLPEGLISECVALIEPAIRVAHAKPSLQFKIRLHPVLSREKLLGAFPEFRDLPPNLKWSTNPSLEADLATARWALYRGSTAIIRAVQCGVRPIYFAMPDEEFCVDPLASLEKWRLRASCADSLSAALSMPLAEGADQDLASAREYCERYFLPMNPNILIEMLKN